MPTLALWLALAAAPAESPKLVVLQMQHLGGATEAEARSLDDAVVAVVTKTGLYQVISSHDLSTLLSMERQKQLLGCSEEAQNCLTELSGALDARYLLSATLNKTGRTYQLTLQTIDARKTTAVGRSLRGGHSLDELRAVLPWAVADATGTPAPRPPSKVWPTSLMVLGGLGLIGGAFVAFQTETREQAVLREFNAATGGQRLPRSAAEYQAEAVDISKQKTSELFLLAVGALVAGGGLWWLLSLPDAQGGRLALVPTGNGLGLAGMF